MGRKSKFIGYDILLSDDFKQGKTKSGETVGEYKKVTIDKFEGELGGESLYLHTIEQEWQPDTQATKGAVISSLAGKGMGVSAWVYKTDAYAGGQSYFSNDQHSVGSGAVTTGRYWPQQKDGWNFRFYAYAPVDAQNGEVSTEGSVSYVKLPDASEWTGGVPSFSYTVPSDVTKQADLLVASSDVQNSSADYGTSVPMDFGHALTAVQFKIAESVKNFKLYSIKLSGVKNSGTYKYAFTENGDGNNTTQTHDGGQWSGQSGSGEYLLDFTSGELDELDKNDIEEEKNCFLCPGAVVELNEDESGYVLFMMPQDLTVDATITMTGYDVEKNVPVELTASIGGDGKSWKKGQRVVYILSVTDVFVEYVFEVVESTSLPDDYYDNMHEAIPDTRIVPFYGQLDRSFKVRSYKATIKRDEVTIKPLPWNIKSTIPNWIDRISTTSGLGGTTVEYVETVEYDVISQTPICSSFEGTSSHENMKNFKYDNVSKYAAYDLSMVGGTRNTANCYIVDAPGYYKLPLVYGNAITNGDTNESSFMYSGSSTYYKYNQAKLQPSTSETAYTTANYDVMQNFHSYAGSGYEINKPWITDEWVNVNDIKAEVVWQDEPCLVTEAEVVIEGDGRPYLRFRVREDCICEGNAVVAIKLKETEGVENEYGQGTIFWSWHIWITDKGQTVMKLSNNLLDSDGDDAVNQHQFELMNVPLGYCNAEEKVYEPRIAQLEFSQFEDGSERATKVFSITQVGDNPYTERHPDNIVYYQFGRKDPIISGYQHPLKGGNNKPYYTERRLRYCEGYGGGRVGFSQLSDWNDPASAGKRTIHTIADGILLPGQMFEAPQKFLSTADANASLRIRHWYDDAHLAGNEAVNTPDGTGFYINLWNNKNSDMPMFTYSKSATSNEVYVQLDGMVQQGMAKTIYDPSPAGYEVPVIDAFAGLTSGGLNYEDAVTFNNQYNPSFYTAPHLYAPEGISFKDDTGAEFKIGAFGYKSDVNGTIMQYGIYGGALTSNPICVQWSNDDESQSWLNPYFLIGSSRLYFIRSTNTFWPIASSSFAHAFPVIPAKTSANPISSQSTE